MITLNGYKIKMNKGRGKDTTATTSKPMQMLSTTNYKEANKRPGRGGKHHGYINPLGIISRILHKQYTRARKTKDINPREKG